MTSILTDMPKAKSREIEDQNAEVVTKMIDLHYELNRDLVELMALKKEIEKTIWQLENPTYRLLLSKRYIDCKTWEWIAVEMGYTWQHLHRLHKRALDMIKM